MKISLENATILIMQSNCATRMILWFLWLFWCWFLVTIFFAHLFTLQSTHWPFQYQSIKTHHQNVIKTHKLDEITNKTLFCGKATQCWWVDYNVILEFCELGYTILIEIVWNFFFRSWEVDGSNSQNNI